MFGIGDSFYKDGVRAAKVEDAEAIATINVACWRSAYNGIIDPDILANRSIDESADRWRGYLSRSSDRPAVIVAEQDRKVLSFGSAIAQRDPHLAVLGYSGEISTLYVAPGQQGRGIGSRLLRSLACNLVKDGHISGSVWVLEHNASGRRFYERLKGRLLPLRQELPQLGNATEVAYAWPFLRALCSSSERPQFPSRFLPSTKETLP